MIRVPPVALSALNIRRALGGSASLADISVHTRTLCKAEVTRGPAAIYLEEALGRVSGVGPDTTIEQEMRRIEGGMVENAPTVAYAVAKARLYRGNLYAGRWKQRLLALPEKGPRRREPWVARTGALASTLYGNTYFGHWIRDDLTLFIAAEDQDFPVVVAGAAYRHEPGYRDLLGLTGPACTEGLFERLLVLQDVGQNSFKKRRYQELCTRLRRRFPVNGSRFIYIRRGTHGARERRLLVNSAEVEGCAASLGFQIIDPDQLSSEEIVRQTMGANLVMGVEGSHLAHAAYTMAQDAVLCVLQPPDRFNNVCKDYSDCLEQRYSFVVGAPAESGFVVQPDEIQRTLDAIEKQVRL